MAEFARMVPAGVAIYADKWGVELIVGAMTKFRAGTAKSADMQQFSTMLSRFGLTPADRNRFESRELRPLCAHLFRRAGADAS